MLVLSFLYSVGWPLTCDSPGKVLWSIGILQMNDTIPNSHHFYILSHTVPVSYCLVTFPGEMRMHVFSLQVEHWKQVIWVTQAKYSLVNQWVYWGCFQGHWSLTGNYITENLFFSYLNFYLHFLVIIFFYVYECSALIYVCALHVCLESTEEGPGSSGTGVKQGCKLLCTCWELNPVLCRNGKCLWSVSHLSSPDPWTSCCQLHRRISFPTQAFIIYIILWKGTVRFLTF